MKSVRIGMVGIALSAIAFLAGCTPAVTDDEVTKVDLTVSDVWIKAVPDLAADGDMTGMFMTIENSGDEDLYVTGGEDLSGHTESLLEAHEVVADDSGQMVMQKAEGGILVPAHGKVQLMPGGFHIMFWNLTTPIAVGDSIDAKLKVSDGSTIDVTAVAMTIDNGTETYVSGNK